MATINESPDAYTVRLLRAVMALFTGLLIASTWPLWTPGTEFPDIPWFAWAVGWPPKNWDWLWLAGLGGLLLSQLAPRSLEGRRLTIARFGLFATAVMLLPTDQHRLQPWVWQMLIGGFIIGVSPSDRLTLKLLRAFTISIYVWSAVSKFDWAFIEGHGQVLLEGLLTSVGLSGEMLSPVTKRWLAGTFPLGELAVALLLLVPRTRMIGLYAATAMHALLILALGPTGLDHEWGVLIWNAFFIAQAWLLFRPQAGRGFPSTPFRPPVVFAIVVTVAACVLPALSLVGLWDWWPSWAVYSSRPAVVEVSFHENSLRHMPDSLLKHVGPPQPLSPWYTVNLDAWSFETCWCPMYPQERYRLAVATSVARDAGTEMQIRVRSTPDRWTGRRTVTIPDKTSPDERLPSFWFNTRQRSHWRREPLD